MRSRFLFQVISVIVMVLVAFSANAAIKVAPQKVIVVFGDSLSAGYGIPQNESWVSLLQARLSQQKLAYTVINASISGETTSGGLARFNEMLTAHKPSIVILELGANDGLRGLPVSELRNNLNNMILQAKAAKTKLLLVGMKIPPNYGQKYSRDFSASYAILAKQHKIKLVPFLLDGVAGKPSLIQDDGLHPLAVAQPALLNNVWAQLKSLLK
jgi:acyl-CoA thioesterase I